MDFATQLRNDRDKTIIDHANNFFENEQEFIKKSAEEGYTSCSFSLMQREDKHILKDPLFITTLEGMLSGCVVKVVNRKYKNTLLNFEYEREHLLISWKGEK